MHKHYAYPFKCIHEKIFRLRASAQCSKNIAQKHISINGTYLCLKFMYFISEYNMKRLVYEYQNKFFV